MLIKNDFLLKGLGKRLQTLRLSKKLSQEELANMAEIPISQVGRIERGEINTTIVTLKALADALEIDLVKLIDIKEENKKQK